MLSRLTARFPTAVAATIYLVVTALAYLPLWAGRVLLPEMSDQRDGYAFRSFAAEHIRAFGEVPGWYPHLFGGMPFSANTAHGDTFFPTALLRLAFPVDVGMAVGFMVFTVLAGVFAFVFLRTVRLSWPAAFVGGAAYMFTGQVISLASPGHDGKLFVSALMPLALAFLYRATAMRDWRQYLYFGVTVGFSLLTPHFQMTYYLLMAAGFFWAFMVFFSDEKAGADPWWRSALLFGGALAVAVGIAAIQLAPFAQYLPFSPRGVAGSSSTGWDYAIGWSMPPEEILNSVWPAFSGMLENYWGRNQFKLHSEYMGVGVALLALLSFRLHSHRRMAWFFVFLAIYGTLFAFGGFTPFYRIPYTVLPLIKGTRAVSMIYTLTSFSIAVLAAFGTQWLASRATVVKATTKQARETLSDRTMVGVPRPVAYGVIALGVFALLAAAGAWKPMMEALGTGSRAANPCADSIALCVDRSYPAFIADTFRVLIFGIAIAGMTLATVRRRWTSEAWALAVAAIVLIDLYSVERRYLRFSPRASETLAADDVVRTLQQDSSVFRVLPLHGEYMNNNYLMVHGLRTAFGYNGQEIHRYDELLGGKNIWATGQWREAANTNLWAVLGIKYVILAESVSAPIIERVAGPLRTRGGNPAFIYRVVNNAPYAFLVRDALRVSQPDEQIYATVINPRFDPRRLLLLPKEAPVGRDSLSQLPEPVNTSASVHEERAGQIRIDLATPPTDSMYLYVAENWYPYWSATVDGRPAAVVRAQGSMMAVRVPPGAQRVLLRFHSSSYATGRLITILSVLAVIALGVATSVLARRRRTAPLPVPAGAAA
jgi:hypothetical protein